MGINMAGKVFVIADTHFGDEAILRYENRPFQNVLEMDEIIIQNWNNIVTMEDEVFHLGDFSFYNHEKTKKIGRCLNGRKTLILGNHDTEPVDFYKECGFSQVIPYPIILDGFFIFSHEPLYINRNMPYANIFGHVHGNGAYSDFSRQSYCVCVERTAYQPVEFTIIKEIMHT